MSSFKSRESLAAFDPFSLGFSLESLPALPESPPPPPQPHQSPLPRHERGPGTGVLTPFYDRRGGHTGYCWTSGQKRDDSLDEVDIALPGELKSPIAQLSKGSPSSPIKHSPAKDVVCFQSPPTAPRTSSSIQSHSLESTQVRRTCVDSSHKLASPLRPALARPTPRTSSPPLIVSKDVSLLDISFGDASSVGDKTYDMLEIATAAQQIRRYSLAPSTVPASPMRASTAPLSIADQTTEDPFLVPTTDLKHCDVPTPRRAPSPGSAARGVRMFPASSSGQSLASVGEEGVLAESPYKNVHRSQHQTPIRDTEKISRGDHIDETLIEVKWASPEKTSSSSPVKVSRTPRARPLDESLNLLDGRSFRLTPPTQASPRRSPSKTPHQYRATSSHAKRRAGATNPDVTLDLAQLVAQAAKPKRPSGTEESFLRLGPGAIDEDFLDVTLDMDDCMIPASLRPRAIQPLLSPVRSSALSNRPGPVAAAAEARLSPVRSPARPSSTMVASATPARLSRIDSRGLPTSDTRGFPTSTSVRSLSSVPSNIEGVLGRQGSPIRQARTRTEYTPSATRVSRADFTPSSALEKTRGEYDVPLSLRRALSPSKTTHGRTPGTSAFKKPAPPLFAAPIPTAISPERVEHQERHAPPLSPVQAHTRQTVPTLTPGRTPARALVPTITPGRTPARASNRRVSLSTGALPTALSSRSTVATTQSSSRHSRTESAATVLAARGEREHAREASSLHLDRGSRERGAQPKARTGSTTSVTTTGLLRRATTTSSISALTQPLARVTRTETTSAAAHLSTHSSTRVAGLPQPGTGPSARSAPVPVPASTSTRSSRALADGAGMVNRPHRASAAPGPPVGKISTSASAGSGLSRMTSAAPSSLKSKLSLGPGVAPTQRYSTAPTTTTVNSRAVPASMPATAIIRDLRAREGASRESTRTAIPRVPPPTVSTASCDAYKTRLPPKSKTVPGGTSVNSKIPGPSSSSSASQSTSSGTSGGMAAVRARLLQIEAARSRRR